MHLNMFLMALLGHGFVQAKLVANGPELDLVLRQMGDFDFDIISVEDQGDEDVFYFRRAAPVEQGKPKEDDCEKDDCAAFNAWSGEEMSQEDDKDEGDDGEDDNQNNAVGKRETTIASGGTSSSHTLSKRKPKPAKLCAKTLIDGKTTFEPQIQFQSHAYPAAGNKKIKDFQKVYDFVEFSNPNKDQWFQIGNVKTRRDGRNYASEHILEWESFLLFLHNDKGKTNKENELKNSNKKQGDVSDDDREDPELCRTLHMYWNKKFPFTVKYPSQVGTNWDTANLKDTKFDKTALEFVGHQFPGGSSVSPYTDELVILENGVNSRKEQLWMGNNLSPFLVVLQDGKVSDQNKRNWMTMQFNLEHNRWWHKTEENKESTPEKNQGRCLAIGKFRDVLGVYQYHQDDHIQKIMKTQIKRIEEAFKTVEDVIIPQGEAYFKDKDGKARPAYKSLGLDKKWKDFMTDVYDARIIKIEEWMDKWAQQFREFLKQDGKITGLGQMFQKRAPAWTDQCGVATDDEIKHRINLLLEAYEDRGKMENPIDW